MTYFFFRNLFFALRFSVCKGAVETHLFALVTLLKEYLTSAKFLTYYCLSAILLVRERNKFGDYFLHVCCRN